MAFSLSRGWRQSRSSERPRFWSAPTTRAIPSRAQDHMDNSKKRQGGKARGFWFQATGAPGDLADGRA